MMTSENISIHKVVSHFPELFVGTLGDEGTLVGNILPSENSNEQSLIFVSDKKLLEGAFKGPSKAIVVSAAVRDTVENLDPEIRSQKVFLFSKNVKLAMALIKAEFFFAEAPLQAVGSRSLSAVIDSTAKIGKNVSIGAHSVIGKNVVIEDDVCIDALVVIEADCLVKKGSHLYSHLYIGPRTIIGENCELMANSTIGAEGFGFAHDEKGRFHRIPQTGNVILGNDVEIGSHCTIDRATFGSTTIGEGTKIDKQCHIAHNCQIGKHSVIAGCFAVAGSTKIGDHFICGGRVTIRDGLTISAGVELAAGSGVFNDIPQPGRYGGIPLLPIMDHIRTAKTIPHLPKIKKNLAKLAKHVNLNLDDTATDE